MTDSYAQKWNWKSRKVNTDCSSLLNLAVRNPLEISKPDILLCWILLFKCITLPWVLEWEIEAGSFGRRWNWRSKNVNANIIFCHFRAILILMQKTESKFFVLLDLFWSWKRSTETCIEEIQLVHLLEIDSDQRNRMNTSSLASLD